MSSQARLQNIVAPDNLMSVASLLLDWHTTTFSCVFKATFTRGNNMNLQKTESNGK